MYDFSSTMLEPNKVLMRFLIAARSSLVMYTARASSMNFCAEAAGAFLVADVVFDDPEGFVDAREVAFLRPEIHGGGAGISPGILEQLELVFDVRDFRGVTHARGLDAQDGDLVQHFARADRYQYVFHVCARLAAHRACC